MPGTVYAVYIYSPIGAHHNTITCSFLHVTDEKAKAHRDEVTAQVHLDRTVGSLVTARLCDAEEGLTNLRIGKARLPTPEF